MKINGKLELHSVERIYLRQRCFDASNPRVAAATDHGRPITMPVGFSRRNKIPRCSAYDIAESNPVPASGLWSESRSKVDRFVHVPTPVDTQNVNPNPCMRFWVILLTDRQTDIAGIAFTSSVVGGNNGWPAVRVSSFLAVFLCNACKSVVFIVFYY